MSDLIELECLNVPKLYPNNMLIDYLSNNDPMKSFFPGTNKKFHSVKYKGDRSILKEVLLDYNRQIDASDKVIENIETVEADSTKFVVTGQQPGFLTGPLYTIYKTLSAISYAEKYSTKKQQLIPLFWNASEDHDVEEVNNIWLLDKKNDVIPVVFDDKSIMGKSLERIPIDKTEFTKLIDTIIDVVPETDFTEAVFDDIIKKELSKSEKWGEYFSRLMTRLMSSYGLIIIEPKIFRPYLTDYFKSIASSPKKYNNIFLKTTEKLEKLGYNPKMHKKEEIVGLFHIDEDHNRNSIIQTEDGSYDINGTILSKEELLDKIDSTPEDFSTNAIFRPLAQDLMIPTHIFVGGPSEIGYHIQIKDLYREFSLIQPNLMFRMGATIIERHINRVLEKYPINITDLTNVNYLTNKLLRKENKDFLEPYFNRITNSLSDLSNELESINTELASRVKGRGKAIEKSLSDIEGMYIKYIKDDNEILVRQIEKAGAYLFPDNKPQERVFNIFQYLNKYNPNLINCIKESMSKAEPCNHVVLKCWMF